VTTVLTDPPITDPAWPVTPARLVPRRGVGCATGRVDLRFFGSSESRRSGDLL